MKKKKLNHELQDSFSSQTISSLEQFLIKGGDGDYNTDGIVNPSCPIQDVPCQTNTVCICHTNCFIQCSGPSCKS